MVNMELALARHSRLIINCDLGQTENDSDFEENSTKQDIKPDAHKKKPLPLPLPLSVSLSLSPPSPQAPPPVSIEPVFSSKRSCLEDVESSSFLSQV